MSTKTTAAPAIRLQQMALPRPKHEMSMGTWMATEGGRKCPQCGRYAKARDLGWIGFNTPEMCLDMYGHLPGKGCNRRKRQRQSEKVSDGLTPRSTTGKTL
jgi:hypothetical protein